MFGNFIKKRPLWLHSYTSIFLALLIFVIILTVGIYYGKLKKLKDSSIQKRCKSIDNETFQCVNCEGVNKQGKTDKFINEEFNCYLIENKLYEKNINLTYHILIITILSTLSFLAVIYYIWSWYSDKKFKEIVEFRTSTNIV